MNWEMIAGCVWLVALLYCVYEAYFTPISSSEDTNGYSADVKKNPIFIKKVKYWKDKKKAYGSKDEEQHKVGFYNGKDDTWIKNK
tara:strand:+ start:742 stop:996 length:255 start_codon:yes stop_codon:yes gene_type:complete